MRRILLLLLLLEDLALLHLFHDLLGSADGTAGSARSEIGWGTDRVLHLRSLDGWLLFRLLGDIFIAIVVLLGAIHRGVWSCAGACEARTENNLPRRAPAQVTGEKDVVSGTLQELGEDVARFAGAVFSVDAFVAI